MESHPIIPRSTCCLLLGLLTSVAAVADDCEALAARVGHGGVLWSEQAVLVQGTAAPSLSSGRVNVIKAQARRAAQVDAWRKAASVLAGLSLSGTVSATDVPGATSTVSALVRGATVCKTSFYADGGVDVVLKVPLTGALAAAALTGAGSIRPSGRSEWTGLVVDARHLPFEPALVPRLLGPDGTSLFDVRYLSPEMLARAPGVVYVAGDDVSQAPGDRPFETRAMMLGPDSPGDLVLDADAASALAQRPAFLGDGRVVVRLSAPPLVACRDLAAGVTDLEVDWYHRVVLARGHGQVDFDVDREEAVRMRMMERAAEVDAERRLALTAPGLLAGDESGAQPGETRPFRPVLMNTVRCGAKYFRDGKAEVVLAAPIDRMRIPADWSEAGKDAEPGANAVTGVILDASGVTDFEPSYAPSVVAGSVVVFDAGRVGRAWGRRYGGAAYHRDLDAARNDPRIGNAPVIVRVTGTAGNGRQLVVAVEDAAQFDALAGILHRAAVAIVTGDP